MVSTVTQAEASCMCHGIKRKQCVCGGSGPGF